MRSLRSAFNPNTRRPELRMVKPTVQQAVTGSLSPPPNPYTPPIPSLVTDSTGQVRNASAVIAALKAAVESWPRRCAGYGIKPQRTTAGEVVHVTACPLRPAAPSQMQATLDAMARARARLRQAGAEGPAAGLEPAMVQRNDAWVLPFPITSALSAKVKRRPVDGRRFGEGETDGSYPSPSPAPDYGDLAGDRQPHHRLVAGRESGLAPGSFPRSRS